MYRGEYNTNTKTENMNKAEEEQIRYQLCEAHKDNIRLKLRIEELDYRIAYLERINADLERNLRIFGKPETIEDY